MPLKLALSDRLFQMVFLAYSALLIFLGRHGGLGISNFDDAYYAQKAKEMLSSGSFWIVLYNGGPTFDNPPVPIWLMASVFKLFGVSDYSVALPAAVFGVATTLLTYRSAEMIFNDRWTAFLAGAILILPGFFVDYARRGMVDVPFTFFVTAALFCFIKAETNPRWHLFFGAFTALAILTKSVLGLFPLMIGFAYGILARPGASPVFRSFYFWAGTAVALVFGSSWHIINILQLGDFFVKGHFGQLLYSRAVGEDGVVSKDGPFFFLGYLKSLWKTYWPWFPFAVAGFTIFAKKAFRDGDNKKLFIILWIAVIIGVMSASKTQALRYVLSAFPALAILTAKTINDCIPENSKERFIPYIAGAIMAVVLFVNATDIQARISLSQNSVSMRQLAPVIRRNSVSKVGNFRLSHWNPRNALLFYADRFLPDPVKDPEELIRRLDKKPEVTWLTSVGEFKNLKEAFPGKLYLIASYERYAYFTSERNKENIRYDLPEIK